MMGEVLVGTPMLLRYDILLEWPYFLVFSPARWTADCAILFPF